MSQNIANIIAGMFLPYDHESITIDATVGGVGLTASKIRPTGGHAREAVRVLITVETAEIRYTYNGTAPTTTVGHILNVDDALTLYGQPSIDRFKAIRTGATSGTIKVTYES